MLDSGTQKASSNGTRVRDGDFYRRRLPHWQPANATYFVTFRLANSIPANVLRQLRAEYERRRRALLRAAAADRERGAKLYDLKKAYFGYFDGWLDRCVKGSPVWLGRREVAEVISNTLRERDGQMYRVLAYCIMPNHVHLVVETLKGKEKRFTAAAFQGYSLTRIVKWIKGRTARQANLLLGRTGPFWEHESYDHVVRDGAELERIVWYVVNNPVRAGLVEDWKSWAFTYVKPGLDVA